MVETLAMGGRFLSVHSRPNKQDLVFLGEETGENDLLSRFLKGPVMLGIQRVWKTPKVWMLIVASYPLLLGRTDDDFS